MKPEVRDTLIYVCKSALEDFEDLGPDECEAEDDETFCERSLCKEVGCIAMKIDGLRRAIALAEADEAPSPAGKDARSEGGHDAL